MPIVEHLIKPDENDITDVSTSSTRGILKVLRELSALSTYSSSILGSLCSEMGAIDRRICESTARADLFVNQRVPFLEQSEGKSLQVTILCYFISMYLFIKFMYCCPVLIFS